MMDREKVIEGLKCRSFAITGKDCEHCHYGMIIVRRWGCDLVRMSGDALALLKAHKPVEPTIGRCEEYDGHDSWWYQCGKCQKPIDYDDKYCRNCGQAVKWE